LQDFLIAGDQAMAAASSESLLARRLNTFLPLSRDEQRHLRELHSSTVRVKQGKPLVQQEAQKGPVAYILQDGWACAYKVLPGGDRQVMSITVPGDCAGLRSVFLRAPDHHFSALTDAVVSPVEGARILSCVNECPRLGAALLWAASRDEALVVERLINIRLRNAIERTAYFFLELAERLSVVGLATKTRFKCPLSHDDLADALGLRAIHVSRVLRQLLQRDLLDFQEGKVRIHDLSGLRKLAGYQGG
jgi:CRP-like cAMP-binding protein